MDYLCELPNDRARREALESLPPDLNATYERILQRLNTSNSYRREIAQRTLMWLLYAAQKLTTKEMCHAISVNLGDDDLDEESIPSEEEILRCCSSLIRQSPDGFELAHFTVREFLVGINAQRTPELSSFHMEKSKSRLECSKVCLTYLNFKEFGNGSVDSAEEWQRIHRKYPFKLHAVQFWKDYWRSRWSVDDIQSLVRNIFGGTHHGTFQSMVQDYFWISFRDELEFNGALNTSDWHRDFVDISCSLASLTPMHFAAMMREDNLVSWLMDNGHSAEQTSEFGQPLYLAVLGPAARWVILKYYGHKCTWIPESPPINHGSSISQKAKGEPRLVYDPPSSRERTSKVIELLIKNGANTSSDSGIFQSSAAFLAAEMAPETLQSLLEAGASIDSRTIKFLIQEMVDRPYHLSRYIHGVMKMLYSMDLADESKALVAQLSLTIGFSSDGEESLHKSTIQGFLNGNAHQYWTALCRAVEYNHVEAVKTLIARFDFDLTQPCNIERYRTASASLLHIAAACGSPNLIKCLLEAGADLNQTSVDGRTALHFCSYDRTSLNFRFLLEQGLDVKVKDCEGWSLWHYATGNCNLKLVEAIIELDLLGQLSTSECNDNGETPLHVLGSLLPKVPDFPILMDTPVLITDVILQCSEILDVFLRVGADPCALSTDGSTVGHTWAIKGFIFPAGIKSLMEKGLDPCATRSDGQTLFHVLAPPRHPFNDSDLAQYIKIVPARRALQVSDNEGALPMHCLCRSRDRFYIPMYNIFMEYGADPAKLNTSGKSSLDIAFEVVRGELDRPRRDWPFLNYAAHFLLRILDTVGSLDTALISSHSGVAFFFASLLNRGWFYEALLEKGFDVDFHGPNLNSGLELACTNNVLPTTVKLLLEKSNHAAELDRFGFGLLHRVCLGTASPDLLVVLLEHGLDPDMRTSRQDTALTIAAVSGQAAHVKVLLDQGADLTAKNGSGRTVTEIATEGGHVDVLKVILEKDPLAAKQTSPVTITFPGGRSVSENLSLLHSASLEGKTNVVDYLLDANVFPSPNEAGTTMVTPLSMAIIRGHLEVVKTLLMRGAHVNISDSIRGVTALHWAADKGDMNIINVLCEYNCDANARDSSDRTPDVYALARGHIDAASKIHEFAQQQGTSSSIHYPIVKPN
jgi:ankyrin repeat protein